MSKMNHEIVTKKRDQLCAEYSEVWDREKFAFSEYFEELSK